MGIQSRWVFLPGSLSVSAFSMVVVFCGCLLSGDALIAWWWVE